MMIIYNLLARRVHYPRIRWCALLPVHCHRGHGHNEGGRYKICARVGCRDAQIEKCRQHAKNNRPSPEKWHLRMRQMPECDPDWSAPLVSWLWCILTHSMARVIIWACLWKCVVLKIYEDNGRGDMRSLVLLLHIYYNWVCATTDACLKFYMNKNRRQRGFHYANGLNDCTPSARVHIQWPVCHRQVCVCTSVCAAVQCTIVMQLTAEQKLTWRHENSIFFCELFVFSTLADHSLENALWLR